MEEALKERALILEKLFPNVFKADVQPNESLIKLILIQKALANNPFKISSANTIKVNVEETMTKYKPIVQHETKPISAHRCALSQAVVVVPWESECGHVFEHNILVDFLSKGEKYCPIHGCKKPLKKKK